MSGFGRILLCSIAIALVAERANAQAVLGDPKNPAKTFASNCAACHKSPQGLARDRSIEGFLRQHYTTGPEMSAAMAAYLAAAGPAPQAREPRGRTPQTARPEGQETPHATPPARRDTKSAKRHEAPGEAQSTKRRSIQTTRPGEPKPEGPGGRPREPATAARQPEPARPEPSKPEPTKPELAKPEFAKPEPAKPDLAKPDPAKPETPKPGAAEIARVEGPAAPQAAPAAAPAAVVAAQPAASPVPGASPAPEAASPVAPARVAQPPAFSSPLP